MIDSYKAQLADLDTLAQSIFLDMFGDPVTNQKGWELHSIASFGKIVTGNTPSKSIENITTQIILNGLKLITSKAMPYILQLLLNIYQKKEV